MVLLTGIPITNVLITDIFWYEISWSETEAEYLVEIHVMAIFFTYELQIEWSEKVITVEWQEQVWGEEFRVYFLYLHSSPLAFFSLLFDCSCLSWGLMTPPCIFCHR